MVHRSSTGQEFLTKVYTLPRGSLPDHATSQNLLQQRGGTHLLALSHAAQILQGYLPHVITEATYTATDLETLRHAFELGLEAIYNLQEGLAREPLPTPTEESVNVDEAHGK
jgi:hypothetical protein